MTRDILVLLDDQPQWLDSYQRWLRDMLEGRQIRVRAFTDDRDAAEFVCASHHEILGYIQDVGRDPYDANKRHGIAFLDGIVRFLTPRARVLIVSASVSFEEAKYFVMTARQVSRILQKQQIEPELLKEYVARVLEEATSTPSDVTGSAWADDRHLLEQLTVPWQTVRRFLGGNPNLLHQLPPRHFEHLVAEMYRDYGWEVELTASTRDGGYDLIALKQCAPHAFRVLVEVKRYHPGRAVGVGIVRGLYGTRHLHHASQVVLATSSHVSRDAKTEFRAAIPHELSFVERDAILEWCRNAGGYPLGGFSDRP
jgi:hypothetical protein